MRPIDADELIKIKFKGIGFIHVPEARRYQMGWNDAIDAIIKNAPTIEPKRERWEWCNIKEPETQDNYLLYRPHFWGANRGQVTVCYWNGSFWSDNYYSETERELPVIDGMAWMPLPRMEEVEECNTK